MPIKTNQELFHQTPSGEVTRRTPSKEPKRTYDESDMSHIHDDEVGYEFNDIQLTIHGEPLAGSQLKFNRKMGSAYRPKEHHQRVFTVSEYADNYLDKHSITKRPLFPSGIAIGMECLFVFPYRKGDYRTGKHAGELKPNPPTWMMGRKDVDNLLKPLKDGMKGLIYGDDSQICYYGSMSKRYGSTPRTEVRIWRLDV